MSVPMDFWFCWCKQGVCCIRWACTSSISTSLGVVSVSSSSKIPLWDISSVMHLCVRLARSFAGSRFYTRIPMNSWTEILSCTQSVVLAMRILCGLCQGHFFFQSWSNCKYLALGGRCFGRMEVVSYSNPDNLRSR